VTPEAIDARTARSRAREADVPALTFATDGPSWLRVTQSTPAMTSAMLPLPSQPITRTGTSVAFLATPKVRPPASAATYVPWPLQSCVPRPSATAE
jgi:hypothetical protein